MFRFQRFDGFGEFEGRVVGFDAKHYKVFYPEDDDSEQLTLLYTSSTIWKFCKREKGWNLRVSSDESVSWRVPHLVRFGAGRRPTSGDEAISI